MSRLVRELVDLLLVGSKPSSDQGNSVDGVFHTRDVSRCSTCDTASFEVCDVQSDCCIICSSQLSFL